MWSARRIASLLLGLTIALAGCGGSSEDQSIVIEGSDEGGSEQASTYVSATIEGRWVLESWKENGASIDVEVGVNTVSEPWIEFT